MNPNDKEELAENWKYDFAYWLPRFESHPIRLVVSGDHSESYEMERFHVFKLENGKFATVHECGCSCYESEDASIDILPTLSKAMSQFEEWEKKHRRNEI